MSGGAGRQAAGSGVSRLREESPRGKRWVTRFRFKPDSPRECGSGVRTADRPAGRSEAPSGLLPRENPW